MIQANHQALQNMILDQFVIDCWSFYSADQLTLS